MAKSHMIFGYFLYFLYLGIIYMPLSLTKSKRGGYARKKSRRHKRYKSRKSKSRKLRNRSSKILRGGRPMTDTEIKQNITLLLSLKKTVKKIQPHIELLVRTLFHVDALDIFYNNSTDFIKSRYRKPSDELQRSDALIDMFIFYLYENNVDYKNMFILLCAYIEHNIDIYISKEAHFKFTMLEYFKMFLDDNYSEEVMKDIIGQLYIGYDILKKDGHIK